ncbi:cyanogenic beta-glucosidase-like [Primulina eburnea]|uniref:cyanogenic beta-glucosidase-like n=1 Tax=Primulina eburnea TaxID=1245227 RepID=UPI003C6BF3DF
MRKRVYSKLCFQRCGDRVKNWITFNEPYTYVTGGYVRGEMAPGRCSSWQNLNCTAGDSGVEPYLVAHHQLLSHAAAVMKYKEKYQEGVKLLNTWLETDRSIGFCRYLSDKTSVLKPNEVPHSRRDYRSQFLRRLFGLLCNEPRMMGVQSSKSDVACRPALTCRKVGFSYLLCKIASKFN